MNYYIDDDYSLKFFADSEMTEELTAEVTTAGGNKKYTLPVSPQDIDDEIISVSYDENGKVLNKRTYSLKTYLNKVAQVSPKYVDLINNLKSYCYSIKNYRGEKVADDDAASLPTDFSETVESTMNLAGTDANNRFTGAKVMFGSEYNVKFYFVTDATNYVVKASVAGGEEVTLDTFADAGENNRLCAMVEGIKPYYISDKIVIKLYINGSDTAVSTFTYSVTDYCANMSGKTSNTALKKLVYATYNMYAALRDALAAA